jgi:hypothetical protein
MGDEEAEPGGLVPTGDRAMEEARAGGSAVTRTERAATRIRTREPVRVDPRAEFASIRDDLARLSDPRDPNEGRTPAQPDRQAGQPLASRGGTPLIAALVVLGFALGGFWLLPAALAFVWFLFLFVAFPIALAFTVNAPTFGGNQLLELYKAGLKELPAIGRILGRPSSKKNG